jgi:phosphatidate cytidylyltransferase
VEAAKSNLALRLLTAVVAVPAILALLYVAPPWAFYLLVLAATLVGCSELFAMTHPGDRVAQVFGVVVSAGVSVTLFRVGLRDVRVLLTLLVVVPAATFTRPRCARLRWVLAPCSWSCP